MKGAQLPYDLLHFNWIPLDLDRATLRHVERAEALDVDRRERAAWERLNDLRTAPKEPQLFTVERMSRKRLHRSIPECKWHDVCFPGRCQVSN